MLWAEIMSRCSPARPLYEYRDQGTDGTGHPGGETGRFSHDCSRCRQDRCQDIRRTGCASLDLCWVASGRLDGFVELALQPWDYAAGLLLVEEAGGRATAVNGSPLSLTQGGSVLASNGILHQPLLNILNR